LNAAITPTNSDWHNSNRPEESRCAMSTRIETVANISTIVAALAVLTFVIGQYRKPSAPRFQPTYGVGEDVSKAIPVEFYKAKHTMLLVVQTHCPACNASLSFYRSLIAERDKRAAAVQIVVVGAP
jgi:hypothetical protein